MILKHNQYTSGKIILSILLLMFFLTISAQVHIEKGRMDLRHIDLNQSVIKLNGEWEFYWMQQIAPYDAVHISSKDYYLFPKVWNNNKTAKGVELTNEGYATYYSRIILPENHPLMGISINNVNTAANIYVNGKLLDACGTATDKASSNKPEWLPKVIEIEDADTINVVMHISNFEHIKGGARRPILIGKLELLQRRFFHTIVTDLVMSGILIMTGLFFIGLFFFGLNKKPALFFGLFCLLFTLRIIGSDDYVLHMLLPHLSFDFGLRLEYLALYVPIALFSLYTHFLFEFNFRINPFFIVSGIFGIFSLVVIFFPSTVFTGLVEMSLIVLLAAIVLAGWTYIKAFRLKLPGSKYAVVSTITVFAIFIYNIILYFGVEEENVYVTFTGYLSFFFFQSLILFYIFTHSLKLAKENAENAARSKSEFLSRMSHEIRTPMNAVIGLSNYMLNDKPKEEHRETLETLSFSAQSLLVIINDILDLSKIEADKIVFENEEVNIRTLLQNIRRVFNPLAKDKSLQLLIECDPQIPDVVICDQTRMSQVLTNLVSNAIKFTDEGVVKIKVDLKHKSDRHIDVNFSVSDTGIGIDSTDHDNIFESFTQAGSYTTRKYGGTGLGLSITKKLITLQGSKLFVESERGKGSVFSWLQRLEYVKDAEVQPEKKELSEMETVDLRVLLVEDNAVNVLVASKFLKKWGMRYVVANNGLEAIEAVDREKFDVILMDLHMPVMDGYTAVKEIRKIDPNIPIIALTASALSIDRDKIYRAGMNDFVTKPFSPEVLYKKLQACQTQE